MNTEIIGSNMTQTNRPHAYAKRLEARASARRTDRRTVWEKRSHQADVAKGLEKTENATGTSSTYPRIKASSRTHTIASMRQESSDNEKTKLENCDSPSYFTKIRVVNEMERKIQAHGRQRNVELAWALIAGPTLGNQCINWTTLGRRHCEQLEIVSGRKREAMRLLHFTFKVAIAPLTGKVFEKSQCIVRRSMTVYTAGGSKSTIKLFSKNTRVDIRATQSFFSGQRTHGLNSSPLSNTRKEAGSRSKTNDVLNTLQGLCHAFRCSMHRWNQICHPPGASRQVFERKETNETYRYIFCHANCSIKQTIDRRNCWQGTHETIYIVCTNSAPLARELDRSFFTTNLIIMAFTADVVAIVGGHW